MSTPILIQFFVGDERIAQVIVEVAMMNVTIATFLSARHAAGKPMGCAIAERVR